MRKTKFSHKVMAIFLTLSFAQSFVPYNILLASNNGPVSPEAASFEPVDAADIVNLSSGDLSYVLPLLNVPSPEGGYPLGLSYNAGIAMEQEASWTGLGWNLNPGAINRSVSGYPDDWKQGRVASLFYDKGGIARSYSLGVSVALKNSDLASIGIRASYGTNKTFGGETSHGFDIAGTASLGIGGKDSPFKVSGSIGTNGIGASIGMGVQIDENRATTDDQRGSTAMNTGFSIGASYSFKGKGLSANAFAGAAGTGFGLSTRGGAYLSVAGNNISLSGSDATALPLSTENVSFAASIPIPYTPLTLDLGFNKTRYWLFDKSELKCIGSLYPAYIKDVEDNAVFVSKVVGDAYESVYSIDERLQGVDNNLSFISYDGYSVSGQGIGGSISPKIFEQGALKLKSKFVASGTALYAYDDSFTKQIDNSSNDIHFDFNETYASYLKVISGDWIAPSGDLGRIIDLQISGKSTVSTVYANGTSYDNYNTSKKRRITGPFIETYTNQEIIDDPDIIIESKNLDRSQVLNSGTIENYSNGIGAYRITALDGKTYHYSLPVYQKEKFTRSAEKDKDMELSFYEEQTFTPYATHWLLTAVTGPDYFDANNNGITDEQDHGYWVEFEYGKWSDGYSWRNPSVNSYEGEKSKSYSWGIKEIYYLDKVKTRTHTALFIKEDRLDNKSSIININAPGDPNSPKDYEDTSINRYTIDENGDWYFTGIYTEIPIPAITPFNWSVYAHYKFHVKINQQKSLRLKKIILLKNEDIPQQLDTSNGQEPASGFEGKMKFEEYFRIYDDQGRYRFDQSEVPVDKIWYGEYYQNVLDTKDLEILTPQLESSAHKVIDLNYDETYPLAKNSFTSSAQSKGRLTLDNVVFKGKKGTQLLPPYKFTYDFPNTAFNIDNMDDWGYYKNNPAVWSLREIQTPTGSSLKFAYESDDFNQIAAGGKRSFDSDELQLRFTGSDPGQKWVDVRWNPEFDDINNPDNDFRNYFQVGEISKGARIEYNRHSSKGGKYNKWMARILNQDLIVTSVERSQVQFQIPSIGETSENFDLKTMCDDNNFVYYRDYDDGGDNVVRKTAGFVTVNTQCDISHRGNNNIKAFFQATEDTYSQNRGGGIRVKSVTTTDNSGKNYRKDYFYNSEGFYKKPGNVNYQSSGITSYVPTKYFQEIPYRTELPAPGVLYNRVTVENVASDGKVNLKTIYNFKTLEPLIENTDGISMGDILDISIPQKNEDSNLQVDGDDATIQRYRYQIEKRFSGIGKLLSKEVLNNQNQLLNKTVNRYKSKESTYQGITQESFNLFKAVVPGEPGLFPTKFRVNTTSVINYPTKVEKTTLLGGGLTTSTHYDNYDFNTGQLLETRTIAGNGKTFKTRAIPAYTKYNLMGSKVNNIDNKNMLSQPAANYTLLVDGNTGNEEVISANIATWNNIWTYRDNRGVEYTPIQDGKNLKEQIWRKHRTYLWKGNVDPVKGYYLNFDINTDDGFDWNKNAVQSNTKWKKITEVTRYNHFSDAMEIMDINGNRTSSRTFDNDSKIAASSNSAYTEMFYSGGEYPVSNFEGEIFVTGVNTEKVHTGKHSLKVLTNGGTLALNMKDGEHREGPYKISVWADKVNIDNARIYINDEIKEFNGEKISAGDWVQLNHYEDLSSGAETIYLTSANGSVYYDDFRVHPQASSMISYVYNEFDELTDILGSNNLATHFTYDEAGRLCKTFTELIDSEQLSGGFKLINKNQYHYKGMSFYNSCSDISASISSLNPTPVLDQLVSFTVQTSVSEGAIASWEVDFGDSNTQKGTGNPPALLAHTYTDIGQYTVTLNVEADTGERQSTNTIINISNNVYFSNIVENPIGPTTAWLHAPPGSTQSYSLNLIGAAGARGTVIINNVTTNLTLANPSLSGLLVGPFPSSGYVTVSLNAFSDVFDGNEVNVLMRVNTGNGTISLSDSYLSLDVPIGPGDPIPVKSNND